MDYAISGCGGVVTLMGLLLLVLVIVLVMGGLPTWGYHNFGYGPSGIGVILLIILLVLLLSGRL